MVEEEVVEDAEEVREHEEGVASLRLVVLDAREG